MKIEPLSLLRSFVDSLRAPRQRPIATPDTHDEDWFALPGGTPSFNVMEPGSLDADSPLLSPGQIRKTQALSLHIIKRYFTNTYGDDTPLLDSVNTKLQSYDDVRPSPKELNALTGQDPTAAPEPAMRAALRVLINTFTAHTRQDTMLRVAAINKLAKMGHTEDIESLRTPARKGAGVELKAALEAISTISERRGGPDARGGLRDDPTTGPLLGKDNLTPNERSALIEAVLQRGTIKSVSQPGGTNWNEVYFVTFEETLPKGGRRIPIEGVFKPEPPGDGTKKRAFFSREIAAYQLDKLAGTGSVVPTMETIASMEGEAPRIGCMQYKLPNCRELGKSDDRFMVNDDFARFIESDVAKKDIAKIRLISYVLGDTDHFANMRGLSPIYNYNNFLVSLDERDSPMHIVPIDWGSSLGVPDTLVLDGILPTSASHGTLQRLQKLTPEEAQKASGQYIDDNDSLDVGARIDYATKRLDKKK